MLLFNKEFGPTSPALCTFVFYECVLVITNAAYFKLNSSTLNVILLCCILPDRLHEDNGGFIWCELIVKVQLGWLLIHFSGSFMNKLTIFSKLITPVLFHVYFRVHQARLVFKAWLELLVQLWVFRHLFWLSFFFPLRNISISSLYTMNIINISKLQTAQQIAYGSTMAE